VIVYFDTSAILKLLLVEHGSADAVRLWREAFRPVMGRLGYPEARAALAAARGDSRLSESAFALARRGLEVLRDQMTEVGVSRALASRAGRLAERHRLRGYDAVHLACALSLDGPDLLLATWDRELARAGLEEGLTVAPARGPSDG
jgi:hypothetical protein